MSQKTLWAMKFDEHIGRILSSNPATRAVLSRSMGVPLEQAPSIAFANFQRIYQGFQSEGIPLKEGICFFCASVKASQLGKQQGIPYKSVEPSMLLKHLLLKNSSFERRILLLCDTEHSESGLFYRRVSEFLRAGFADGIYVNTGLLLISLSGWNHPSRYVQHAWLRDIFSNRKNKEELETMEAIEIC